MSDFLNCQAMNFFYKSTENEDRQSETEMMRGPERRGSHLVSASQLQKIDEFFQICDSEGRGFITPTDMRVKIRIKNFKVSFFLLLFLLGESVCLSSYLYYYMTLAVVSVNSVNILRHVYSAFL